MNLNLGHLETAKNVQEAVALAGNLGIPQQNLVCADDQGQIAWTIAGFIPQREGWDGRLPETWAHGNHRWDGYRDPRDQPCVVNPEEGRVWTANNRVAAGRDLQIIGDGGYGLGARARQIRDHLRQLDQPVETDMLAVQLDDRALYLAEWRELALEVLARHPAEADSSRGVFQRIVRDQWSGRAEPSSVSYGLVRDFPGAVWVKFTICWRPAFPRSLKTFALEIFPIARRWPGRFSRSVRPIFCRPGMPTTMPFCWTRSMRSWNAIPSVGSRWNKPPGDAAMW